MRPKVDDVVKRRRNKSKRDRKGNNLKKEKERKGRGGTTVRLQQEYNGIEVFGYGLNSHTVDGGCVELRDKRTGRVSRRVCHQPEEYITGVLVEDIQDDLGPIDAVDMHRNKGRAFRQVKARKDKKKKQKGRKNRGRGKRMLAELGMVDSSQPIIFVGLTPDGTQPAQKAYLVKILDVEGDDRRGPSYLNTITDEQGNEILHWEGLNTHMRRHLRRKRAFTPNRGRGFGGNTRHGKFEYGSTRPRLKIGQDSRDTSRCVLENANVRTVHMENSWDMGKSTAYTFPCFTQDGDETNGAYSPMNDAHYYANQVFDMYKDWTGTSPLTTLPLIVKTHYGQNYEGAIYIENAMLFGDGGSKYHPMISLDVIAHEVTHGVTTESSDLTYVGESGGLNEAFSDMGGKAAEQFARGYDKVTWGMAADVAKSTALRCMNNPPCDGHSIDHVRDYKPGMDVHYSSGIYNKVFYLMATALPYNLWDAFDIFYLTNTKYWQKSTDFEKGAELLLKAVDDMKAGKNVEFDYGYIDFDIVLNALKQVGIDCSKSTEWTCKKLP